MLWLAWWRAEQQRLRDEANAKRAEAAKAQIAEQPRDDSGKVQSRVAPQIEALPGKVEAEPSQPAPKPKQKRGNESEAKAKRIGVKRAAVEREKAGFLLAGIERGEVKLTRCHRR
ncbi:hypothetical protein CCR96_19600 [Halochromatium roseum]|nr:hypothetical protein [Halochromatium roseum]